MTQTASIQIPRRIRNLALFLLAVGAATAIYGVIVEDEAGEFRGLLLPDIEGVDTSTRQVEIAARKAGISPGSPLKLSRFRVNRYRERT